MIRWRRWSLFVAVGCAALVALYVSRRTVLPPVGKWLDVGRPPHRAEVVILLNGDENTRPFAAAALVQRGWAPRVLLARVAPSPSVLDGIGLPEHELNYRVLRFCGLREDQIVLLEADAESTYDEAAALAEYLSRAPETRVLLVTSGVHTRRAAWIFRKVLSDRAGEITPISVPSDDFDTARWWESDSGFRAVAGEYLKLGFYGWNYGQLGLVLVGCLVAVGLVWAGLRWRPPERQGAW